MDIKKHMLPNPAQVTILQYKTNMSEVNLMDTFYMELYKEHISSK